MRIIGFTYCLLAFGLVAGTATSQEYTDEQLLGLFQTQRDAFRSAAENGTGKTRGLTMVTVNNVSVSSEATSLSDPALADSAANIAGIGQDATIGLGDTPVLVQPDSENSVVIAGTDAATPLPLDQNAALPVVQNVVFGQLAEELQVNVRISFEFDSAALGRDQAPKLTQLCKVMKASDIKLFRIAGHTDSSGSAEYNEKLSMLRAQEVQRFLIRECGLAANRLEAIGLGERFPFDANNTRADGNRRVEFQALS